MGYEEDEKFKPKKAPTPAEMVKAAKEFSEKLDLFVQSVDRRRTKAKDDAELARLKVYSDVARPVLYNVTSMTEQIKDLIGGAG